MTNYIEKYCETVRKSSQENEKAIRLLYDNRLYKKVVGTLREELELYVKTLYLLSQSEFERERLLTDFSNNIQWKNEKGKRLTDRYLLEYASRITGYGWERLSYKFGCCFIHLSVLQNWENEDVTEIVDIQEKRVLIEYINNYHSANLNSESSFTDIMQYSLNIFKKIKENLECYLEHLEENDLEF